MFKFSVSPVQEVGYVFGRVYFLLNASVPCNIREVTGTEVLSNAPIPGLPGSHILLLTWREQHLPVNVWLLWTSPVHRGRCI